MIVLRYKRDRWTLPIAVDREEDERGVRCVSGPAELSGVGRRWRVQLHARAFALPRYATSVVNAIPENGPGILLLNCIYRVVVDTSHIKWVPFNRIGCDARVVFC